jgi:hypothetical protein
LKEPKYFAPVLDAFVRALPRTYANVAARDGTLIALTITGDSGGKWFLLRENGVWNLCVEAERAADAEVVIDQDTAWRLFTKGISRDDARRKVTLLGDEHLAVKALNTISVIA